MATLQAPAYVGLSSFALSAGSSRPRSPYCTASVARGGLIPYSPALRSKGSKLSAPSSSLGFASSSITETRLQGTQMDILNLGKRCGGGALGAACDLPVSPETLRWVFVAAASVLLFVKNTGIQKQFLVPLLALEVPREAIGWIKGDYGLWAAFFAIAVKLFYFLPGPLELPLYVLLLIIAAPAQLTQYRGSTQASVVTLALAAFASYQHFLSSGSLKGAFEKEKLLPTVAIVALLAVPIVILANGAFY